MMETLNHWGQKLAQFLGDRTQFGVKTDPVNVPTVDNIIRYQALNRLLPYESFDPDTGIFHNRGSQGFILEAFPLLGANEETVNILTSLITDVIPATADIQFLLWASPKIGEMLDRFETVRGKSGDIYAWLAKKRTDYLKQGVFESLSTYGNFILRDFRLWITVSEPRKNDQDLRDRLIMLREGIVSSFKSIQATIAPVGVEEFISVMSDLLHPTSSVYPTRTHWNPYDTLSQQLIDPISFIRVYEDKLSLENDERFEARCLSIKEYPQSMAQWDMTNAIGKLFNDSLQIPCPFVLSFSIRLVDVEKAGLGAQLQSVSKKKAAQSKNSDWMPKIFKEYEDWTYVNQRLSEGDRLVKTHFQLVVFAKEKDGTSSERKVHDLFRSNGWRLKKTKYLQLPAFLSIFPMMMSEGMYQDLHLLGRLRTVTAFNAMNIAPLQGEWKGTHSPHLILPGRRGQIATFNPFDNREGNYNIAIAAASGKGKSAFMQEYIVAMLGAGGRVWVIDIGCTYENTCYMLGGTFIRFHSETKLSLNPFTFIQDFNASLSMLKPLLSAMAHPTTEASDEEITFLEKAAKAAWEEKGNDATITTVADWLGKQSSVTCQNLSHLLYSYTKDGVYGAYFEGKSNIDLRNNFVVLELQELKSKKDLQRIVLLSLMYQISEAMYLGDRSQQKTCLIDEAWDLLGSDNAATGKFIETGFRTARKHNANFVTSVQSINDYFKNEASIASFENSDIKIILGQTSEAIDQINKSDRFAMDAFTERLFKSLRKTDEYSECIIKTPSGLSIHRIIFDPYARILYSSKGDEVAALKRLQAEGYALKDAVQEVVRRK